MIRIQLRIVKENTNLMIGIEILASKMSKHFHRSTLSVLLLLMLTLRKDSFATYSHIHDKAHEYSTT